MSPVKSAVLLLLLAIDAVSDDGIAWRKPALGQVPFKGSRDNNALALPHAVVSGAAVIRDAADPDPARRYKMVYQFFPDQTQPPIAEHGTSPTIACAVSPDGLLWTVTALPFANQFVEHCSLIRHAGAYIVHSQVFPGESFSSGFTEGGAKGGRAGVAHSTYDFDRWSDLWQWAFALPEPLDRAARGAFRDQPQHPQVHLGVGDETRIYHGRWRNAGQKAEDVTAHYRADVAWPRGDLTTLAGRTARILVTLDRGDGAGEAAAPRLYAITLVDAPADGR